MNTLYLRIPANHSATWPDGVLSYALCSQDNAIIREGRSTLADLSSDISKSNVMLLIAATDVTLLELTIPPIPEAKLKLALPNLVEDRLMFDSVDSVLLSIKPMNAESNVESANKRIVAVAQRSWLKQLSSSLFALGAKHIKALPAQVCLPFNADQCSVRIAEYEQDLCANITLRFSMDRGVGILLEQGQSVEERLSLVLSLAPPGSILLQLPSELIDEYKSVINTNPIWAERITVQESNWSGTIQAIKALVGFNLMSGLNKAQSKLVQWQMWRWPLRLAVLTVFVNIVGLNVEYWSLKREALALKNAMAQIYKVSFPKESVVPFPLDQMKKNLDVAQRASGQAAPTDFTVLLSQFGSAWGSINPAQLPKIASIEYKDYSLIVQVKGDMPQEELQKALSAKDLGLKKNNAETWQVRAVK